MLVPEIIILKTVNSFIDFLRQDYAEAVDKTVTVLYDIFNVDDNGDAMAFTYKDSLLQAAITTFITSPEDVSSLQVCIGYNRERVELGGASIHILLPSENKGRIDTLSNDERNVLKDNVVYVDKRKSKQAVYHLMITSANVEQVMVVYYFLQAVFLIFDTHCEFVGMRNLRMSGADINYQQDLGVNVYHRNCTIEFDYEYHIKTRLKEQLINKVKFAVCVDVPDSECDCNNY